MQKLTDSFRCAAAGIVRAVRTERNLKIHLGFTALALFGGWFFRITRLEWLILILTILLVLGAELMNTAVEKVVDLASPGRHPLAGQAKDIAAGAVLLMAIGAVFIGILLFTPYIFEWLRKIHG